MAEGDPSPHSAPGSAPPQLSAAGAGAATPPAGRHGYLLVVLLLAGTLNHLDRQIINILAEPIKLEFGLADWQLGILTGLSFAVLYSLFSVPLAQLAERTSRSTVISLSLGVWSLFTTLSGFVAGYGQLLIARLFVGVAEAGGSAPTHSLVSDCVPREKRTSALAFVSVGIPFGAFLGMLIGGVLIDTHGWRMGFVVAGLPGVVLAVLMALTLRDPHQKRFIESHWRTQAGRAPRTRTTSMQLRSLLSNRSFVLITSGGAMITFVNFSQAAFLASFFFRTHGDAIASSVASVPLLIDATLGAASFLGLALGAAKGVPGVIGTLWGGLVTDRLNTRTMQWMAIIPALSAWLRIPLVIALFLSPDFGWALGCVVLQAFIMSAGAPSGFSSVQGIARPGERALAASVYMLALNLVGLGFGPLAIGLLSDGLAASGLSAAEGLRWALILSGVVGLAIAGALKWAARSSIERHIIG
jgi:MFS family permease